MKEKAEALKLADALDAYWGADSGHEREREAATELRRLHKECENLFIEREHARIMYERFVAPQRKPLTDDEIAELWLDIYGSTPPSGIHEEGLLPWRLARAIEAAHGIKE